MRYWNTPFVAAADLGFDPFQSQDHRVGGASGAPTLLTVVSLYQADIHGQRVLEPDPREEPMEQIGTT